MSGVFWVQKNSFDIFACKQCGLRFVFPTPLATTDVYTREYFYGARNGYGYVDYDNDKLPMLPVFEDYLKRISVATNGVGKLLDVGAATGFFVGCARNRGWDAEGIEVSSAAVEVAELKKLPVTLATLESVDGETLYQVITLFDVLEHVTDPRRALVAIYRLLKPGGVIAISLPDIGSVYARLLGRFWHALVPPEHLFYFTRESLERLLAQTGFSVLEFHRPSKCFTLAYIVSTGCHWLRIPLQADCLQRLLVSRFGRVVISLPLRDNLFILARKEL
jgi:SAM-dependent methyltransferase